RLWHDSRRRHRTHGLTGSPARAGRKDSPMRPQLSGDQLRVLGALLVAVALHLTGTILIPGYSSEFSIRAMLVLASLLAIASLGQTLVIIIGGIDLSIPFIIGFANVVTAQ